MTSYDNLDWHLDGAIDAGQPEEQAVTNIGPYLAWLIVRIPGSTWESRTLAGREVQWASGGEFTVVFWARDAMVAHVTGQPEVVVSAVSRLP